MNVINLIKQKLIKTPWAKYYKKEDLKLKVPDISMYEALKEVVLKYESRTAINYFGKKLSYREFLNLIDKAALAFRSQGVRRGDIVTICMPNTPEAMIAFYAINKIGAISNMIHPLSGEVEIKEYLTSTNSVMLVMIDVCYDKVKNIIKDTSVYKTIVVSARDSMPFFTGLGYQISQGFKIKGPTKSEAYLYWNDFLKKASGYNNLLDIKISRDDPAVILHSGGTTGKPKGIILSNGNFNALTEQAKIVFNDVEVGDRVLGIMPIFHGFGLGVSTIGPFILGCELIMVPQFNAKKFDKLLEKYKPNVIFGVPTLYEALAGTKNDYLDLSGLKYAISGGDSLSRNLIKRVNDYLSSHNAKIKISQGYGMTESLAAVALSYGEAYREDSIGIPFPGNYIKIVTPETQEEVPYGEDGEICISGPTVMLG